MSVGELKHVWERGFVENHLCGCGRSFQSCEFWQAVVGHAFGGPEPMPIEVIQRLKWSVDRVRHMPQMLSRWPSRSYHQKWQQYAEIVVGLYQAIGDVSGAEIIVDSSKDLSTAFFVRSLPGIEAHILHLVRDSRAVAFSWSREKLRPEIVDRQVYMRRHPPIRVAGEWLYWNMTLDLAFAGKGPQEYTFVRYEDFVRSPLATVEQVTANLQLAGQPAVSLEGNLLHLTVKEHTIAGNPDRFQQGVVTIKPDEEWQEKMAPRERLAVTLITWPLLLKYGYASGLSRKKQSRLGPVS